ncbi:MAG TPA: sugar phosphate isomerase/epimerase [Armatimonadetes bacterium]|nr:sugar phosphate isomerase/epimerase [Armatimonadota bacterium]
MSALKIGVTLWSLHGRTLDEALEDVLELELKGIQTWNIGGPLDPDNLTDEARRQFLNRVTNMGLTITGLCAQLEGFHKPDGLRERIEKTKRVMELSVDWGVGITTAHIGPIPEDSSDPLWSQMARCMDELGKYGERIGAVFACETGQESPECLRQFLEHIGSTALKVNYDPANLNAGGFDPVAGVRVLKEYIVHTHVKDSKRGIGEVPVGQGEVPWREYISALSEVGYDGWYAIERERGENRKADIAAAKALLEQL